MNEYQLVEVNYLNQLRLAALELSEVKTELSDLREDNATLRRELDKAENGITLREAREANKEWLLLHGAGDEPDLREIAEQIIKEDRECCPCEAEAQAIDYDRLSDAIVGALRRYDFEKAQAQRAFRIG